MQATCDRKTIHVHCSNSLVRSNHIVFGESRLIIHLSRSSNRVDAQSKRVRNSNKNQTNSDKNWIWIELIVLWVLDELTTVWMLLKNTALLQCGASHHNRHQLHLHYCHQQEIYHENALWVCKYHVFTVFASKHMADVYDPSVQGIFYCCRCYIDVDAVFGYRNGLVISQLAHQPSYLKKYMLLGHLDLLI